MTGAIKGRIEVQIALLEPPIWVQKLHFTSIIPPKVPLHFNGETLLAPLIVETQINKWVYEWEWVCHVTHVTFLCQRLSYRPDLYFPLAKSRMRGPCYCWQRSRTCPDPNRFWCRWSAFEAIAPVQILLDRSFCSIGEECLPGMLYPKTVVSETSQPELTCTGIGKKSWLFAKLQPGRARKRINAT